MTQPTKDEITNHLKKVIAHEITREEVGAWAFTFIANDDNVEVNDVEAWHYLLSVSDIDLMIAPHQYLYSTQDIKALIEEN